MELKKWMKEHKKGTVIIAAIVVLGIGVTSVGVAGYSKMSEKSHVTKVEVEEKEDLFASVKGIKDLYVEQYAKEIDWLKEISSNKRIKVTVDDKKVDLSKPGKYELIYIATILGEEEAQVKRVTVTVVDSKEAQKLSDQGATILISKNEKKAVTKQQETVKKEEKKTEEKKEKTFVEKTAEKKVEAGKKEEVTEKQPQGQEEISRPQQGNVGGSSNTSKPGPAPQPEKPSQPEKKPVWHDPVYEKKWVVDQAAWDETISEPIYEMVLHWYCNTCNADISADPEGHVDETMHGGYRSEYKQEQVGTNTHTIHHDEIGHWEDVLVQEGYWE